MTAKPVIQSTNLLGLGKSSHQLRGTPPNEIDLHVSSLRPTNPFLNTLVPPIHRRSTSCDAGVGSVDGNANVVSLDIGMFIERGFDGVVDLRPLRRAERKEIFGLPTPFVSTWQNTIALDAGVRIPCTGELGVPWCLKSRKLGAEFLEPCVLRPVQRANVIPIDGDHRLEVDGIS